MRQKDGSPVDLSTAPGPAAEGGATERQRADKQGVLVVDDEHMVRIMVQLGLERNGFDVWSAPNGREAIRLFDEHRARIAVVLLDVRMPGLDGLQTLDGLRALNPHIPACFMTGDSGDHESEELLGRGGVYIIAKPFHLEQLTNILRYLGQGVPAALLPPTEPCKA
jgi:two-component system cell cycle sensor histidine kinase/response regulator CckA